MEQQEDTEKVIQNIQIIRQKITDLAISLKLEKEPRLVAVSKTKPSWMVQACYQIGHRHFGENYVKELIDKAMELPKDIEWHFIGHLQSNKVKTLLSIPNLSLIETVDGDNLANTLNKVSGQLRNQPLRILVQVNTSSEDTKSGCDPSQLLGLIDKILKEYTNLKFCGLMTIGSPNPSPDQSDFKLLMNLKKQVCDNFGLDEKNMEISMGMSNDYETAICMGSTNVRVGSSIFGHRDYSK